MFSSIKSFFGFSDDKKIAEYRARVEEINALEPKFLALADSDFKNQTALLKERYQKGEKLAALLPEAFALTREAAKRTLKMRHFDVQLIGGMVLHDGKIAEMKTGEGKTLMATLPAYLNALSGNPVHLITVNDYLAKRDAAWMGQVYNFLGLTVGALQNQMQPAERKQVYSCDVVYGTNNEFGFDYLRDNMALRTQDQSQGKLVFGIVDEVDSILIDEARTPLIISGMAADNTAIYRKALPVAQYLTRDTHFKIEEKTKHVHLTEEGIAAIEKQLNLESLYDIKNMEMAHIVVQMLRALYLFQRDVDYLIQDGEVKIVDEFTGRILEGRRYGEGLHQAIEAKEKVAIQQESQTLATITFQNFFRMYEKLAGMTGTAKTEEAEFLKIYGLEVIVVPTHRKMVRKDHSDIIYKTKAEKYKAVVAEIKACHAKGQPVLVGTIAIENSEQLASLLRKENIPHLVLNAKYHEKEAEIIKDAGQRGAVTIATNMAGRGTDIVLGADVAALGGLHIIGTERHESRRIDNQLRGRSGRQGDAGSSRFYIALDDDLMRIFGGGRVAALMDRFKIPADTPIEHPLISRQIESAQKKVEQYYFGIRKQVLQFDDVMDRQRKSIYGLRQKILTGQLSTERLKEMSVHLVKNLLKPTTDERGLLAAELLDEVTKNLQQVVPQALPSGLLVAGKKASEVEVVLNQWLHDYLHARQNQLGSEIFSDLQRFVFLKVIDTKWIDHLHNMDVLREGIGLRAYGQQDPLVAYKMEGFKMFEALLSEIELEAFEFLFKAEVIRQDETELVPVTHGAIHMNDPSQALTASGVRPEAQQTSVSQPTETKALPMVNAEKVGRNDLCPCGSGKKYKKCHGVGG